MRVYVLQNLIPGRLVDKQEAQKMIGYEKANDINDINVIKLNKTYILK